MHRGFASSRMSCCRVIAANIRRRNGVSLALVIVVVAEMFIGSTDGLGQRVFEAQQLFAMPDMYAAIFAAGALGYGLNLLFLLIERRFVHWSGK